MKSNLIKGLLLITMGLNVIITKAQSGLSQNDSLQMHKDMAELQKELAPIDSEMKPLATTYATENKQYMAAVKNGTSQPTLDSMKEHLASLHNDFAPFQEKSKTIVLGFISAHPDSYIGAQYLMSFMPLMPLDSVKEYYNKLTPNVRQSTFGQYISNQIKKTEAGSPGNPAANFSTKDINGKDISLSDFKGKYVLLDFWASWCVPCRHSNPHMIELYKKYHPQGLEVIGVSDDDRKPDAWHTAVEKDGVGIWHNVLRGLDMDKVSKTMLASGQTNPEDIDAKYAINALPTKILIDPSGKIIARFTGDDDEVDKQLINAFGK